MTRSAQLVTCVSGCAPARFFGKWYSEPRRGTGHGRNANDGGRATSADDGVKRETQRHTDHGTFWGVTLKP